MINKNLFITIIFISISYLAFSQDVKGTILEIIENENLVENAKKMGGHLSLRLSELQNNHPDHVSNVRNRGLFGAFDLNNGDKRDKLANTILDEGAMMLGCGKKSIRFRPHLNINAQEIDQGFEMINRALNRF